MFILNLVTNLFNATIFQTSNIPTQGINTDNINGSITNYQRLAEPVKDEGYLKEFWGGVVLSAQSIGFILTLFLSAVGIHDFLTRFGMNPLLADVFAGAINLVFVFGFFMVIFNRNTKWIE